MADPIIASYGGVYIPGLSQVKKMQRDDNGYYRCIVGAFNSYNLHGDFYPYNHEVKKMFEGGCIMRRKLNNNQLYGEYGHPRVNDIPFDEGLARLQRIDEKYYSHHFKNIELVERKDDHGRPVFAIYATMLPSGPYASSLEKSLSNPDENVAFSVRAVTADSLVGSTRIKIITNLVTWDYVGEPGIATATQYKTVSLEQLDNNRLVFNRDQLNGTIQRLHNRGVSLESNEMQNIIMIKDSLGWNKVQAINISVLDWR
jgi:hypothetical protein